MAVQAPCNEPRAQTPQEIARQPSPGEGPDGPAPTQSRQRPGVGEDKSFDIDGHLQGHETDKGNLTPAPARARVPQRHAQGEHQDAQSEDMPQQQVSAMQTVRHWGIGCWWYSR